MPQWHHSWLFGARQELPVNWSPLAWTSNSTSVVDKTNSSFSLCSTLTPYGSPVSLPACKMDILFLGSACAARGVRQACLTLFAFFFFFDATVFMELARFVRGPCVCETVN